MSKNIALEKLIKKSENNLKSLEEEINSYDDIDFRHFFNLLLSKFICYGQFDESKTRIKEIYVGLERIRSQAKSAIDIYSKELKAGDSSNQDSFGYTSQILRLLKKVSYLEKKLNQKDIEHVINNNLNIKNNKHKYKEIDWSDLDLNI